MLKDTALLMSYTSILTASSVEKHLLPPSLAFY